MVSGRTKKNVIGFLPSRQESPHVRTPPNRRTLHLLLYIRVPVAEMYPLVRAVLVVFPPHRRNHRRVWCVGYPSGRNCKDRSDINMKNKWLLYLRPEWYVLLGITRGVVCTLVYYPGTKFGRLCLYSGRYPGIPRPYPGTMYRVTQRVIRCSTPLDDVPKAGFLGKQGVCKRLPGTYIRPWNNVGEMFPKALFSRCACVPHGCGEKNLLDAPGGTGYVSSFDVLRYNDLLDAHLGTRRGER